MERIYLDTEYSAMFSYDKKKSGDMLQLSAIAVKDGIEVSRFDQKLKPVGNVWSDQAEKVHGITRNIAMAQRDPELVMNDFVDWIWNLGDEYWEVGAFNGGSDNNYIVSKLVEYGIATKFFEKVKTIWYDGLKDAKSKSQYITTSKFTLSSLCEHFGISINAHDAMEDCIGLWKLSECLDSIKLPNQNYQRMDTNGLSKKEKIEKFISMKYMERGSDGSLFLSRHAVADPSAMTIILSHLWDLHCC